MIRDNKIVFTRYDANDHTTWPTSRDLIIIIDIPALGQCIINGWFDDGRWLKRPKPRFRSGNGHVVNDPVIAWAPMISIDEVTYEA